MNEKSRKPGGKAIRPTNTYLVWWEEPEGYGFFGMMDAHEGIQAIKDAIQDIEESPDAFHGAPLDAEKFCAVDIRTRTSVRIRKEVKLIVDHNTIEIG